MAETSRIFCLDVRLHRTVASRINPGHRVQMLAIAPIRRVRFVQFATLRTARTRDTLHFVTNVAKVYKRGAR
jgi:hypothetical protein